MVAEPLLHGDFVALGGQVFLPTRRRSSRARANDQRLRSGLIELIGESGWDSVSLAGLAARAGLTATAVRSRAESVGELGNDLWEHVVGSVFSSAVEDLLASARSGQSDLIATALRSWMEPDPALAAAVQLVVASMFDDDLADYVGVEAAALMQRVVDGDDRVAAAADVTLLGVAISLLLGYRNPARDLVEVYAGFTQRLYRSIRGSARPDRSPAPERAAIEPEPTWTRPPDSTDPYDLAMLLATVEVLAVKGYHRATLARITRRAGLSAGAIRTRYPDKARLVAHAAGSVLLTPAEMEAVFRRLTAEHPLAVAQATWVSELLRVEHRPDWRVRLDLALTARFEPTLSEFSSSTDVGPYFGLMLLACMTDGADGLPFVVPFSDAYPA